MSSEVKPQIPWLKIVASFLGVIGVVFAISIIASSMTGSHTARLIRMVSFAILNFGLITFWAMYLLRNPSSS